MTRSIKYPLVLAMTSLLGCNVYDPALLSGGGGSTCPAGAVGCLPAKPAADTSSPSDNVTYTFALRDLQLKQTIDPPSDPNQPWKQIGLNLDGYNTTVQNQRSSCNPYIVGDPFETDGTNGIDNAFGHRLYSTLVEGLFPSLQNDMCCYFGRGRGTVLVRLSNWNGTDNDASVKVALLYASDGTSDLGATWDSTTEHGFVALGTSTPAAYPSWQPNTDRWAVNPSSVVAGDLTAPLHSDSNGYVTNGTFVMNLNSSRPVTLFLGQGNIAIPLLDGHFWGRMDPSHNFIVSGGMGGRMGQSEMLETTVSMSGACVDISTVKPIVDQFADVLINPADTDSTQTCNAISVGVSFHGVRAQSLELANESLCFRRPECPVGAGNGNNCTIQIGSDDGICGGDSVGTTCTAVVPPWVDPTGSADGGVDAGP